ncbi:hypothetical protein [Microcystis aeruginosa]|uniref:hypothetical protein n=1 Tax=Microcystis aeruginosa TaxID=1126 RepID=UPI00232BF50D|nr:hypothetical protein [Microcystis aeruginosa]MDB9433720.1 hypothetical protein [Microcystis aeruginosa CS-552/01]
MKILAGDGEGDTFRVNLSLSTKNPTENGFLGETRFLICCEDASANVKARQLKYLTN